MHQPADIEANRQKALPFVKYPPTEAASEDADVFVDLRIRPTVACTHDASNIVRSHCVR
jgi:hypothetical protein